MRLIDRLALFLEKEGISDYKFQKVIGVSNGYLDKTKQGTRGIGSDILEKIRVAYPQLNIIWLLSGEGSMYNTNNEKKYENRENETHIPVFNELESATNTKSKDEIIMLLLQKVMGLESRIDSIENDINFNLKNNQQLLIEVMALIKGASRYVVERTSGADTKKQTSERRTLDKYVSVSLKELMQTDNT